MICFGSYFLKGLSGSSRKDPSGWGNSGSLGPSEGRLLCSLGNIGWSPGLGPSQRKQR